MSCKIVFVGGGSFLWSGRFATDLFLKPSLKGSRLVLVDIDPQSLELVASYCRLLNDQLAADWCVETASLEEALHEADYVMVSIAVGGLDAFHRDYHFPERFGVYHSVGDTVGPAGISRTLRNVPVFIDIARKMERLCPDAWMIHVTNPLAQLTRCVAKATSIKVVGLCHNYEGTIRALADFLGATREEMDAETFGVNHFTFLRNLTCRGETVAPERLSLQAYFEYEKRKTGVILTNTTDDDINAMTEGDANSHDDRITYELFEQFGYFPVGGGPHIAENFPYYLNDPKAIRRHRIRRKGVLPKRLEGRDAKRARVEAILAGSQPPEEPKASYESLADIVESLHTGIACRAVVNLPNTGQIGNLPRNVVVETWAHVGKEGLTPLPSGDVPCSIKGFMEAIIAEEELSVSAALSGDRRLVVEAMFASPLLHRKDEAAALADELLAAQKAYLPQFS